MNLILISAILGMTLIGGTLIYYSGGTGETNFNNWTIIRLNIDKNVASYFVPINSTTLNITLEPKISLISTYRWNLIVCNLTSLSNLNFRGIKILPSNLATINNSYCKENSNIGYSLLTNQGTTLLNRSFILNIPNNTALKVYFGNGTEETIITSEYNGIDTKVLFCADNQKYIYNESYEVGWEVGNTTAIHKGGYQETLLTFQTYPQCINWKPTYEINMSCIIQFCNSIVELDQLTGNLTTIWEKGQVW